MWFFGYLGYWGKHTPQIKTTKQMHGTTNALITNMINLLKSLEEQYPTNVKVK